MSSKNQTTVPTLAEIDAMTAFPSSAQECTALCHDLLTSIEALPGTVGLARLRLLARIRAIRARMTLLHCHICLPE